VLHLCLSRQHDRIPATFSEIIDFRKAKGVIVDRFWIQHFVQRQKKRLCIQKTKVLEKDRHNVSAADIKRYFETFAGHTKSNPSEFPEVIVAKNAKPRLVTIPEVRDDAQLSLLTPISPLGDSTHLFFISKLKTFEKTLLIASAPRMIITEVLFIDQPETIFFPRIAELR
jgi:hypothetical protein